MPVAEFSPRCFKAVQAAMVEAGWCRNVVNGQLRRVKRVFKWGVGEELVPATVHHGAQAIEGLRRFRSGAKETPDVEAVPEADLGATLPHLPSMLVAVVRLQELTGMRVGEVLSMRGAKIDRSGAVWTYRPAHLKTAHFGRRDRPLP